MGLPPLVMLLATPLAFQQGPACLVLSLLLL